MSNTQTQSVQTLQEKTPLSKTPNYKAPKQSTPPILQDTQELVHKVNGKVNKEAILIYALRGLSVSQIAKTMDCDKSYISRLLKPIKDKIIAFQAHNQDRSIMWKYIECEILNSVSSEDIKKANLTQKLTGAGICGTKIQEIAGKERNRDSWANFVRVSVNINSDKPQDVVIEGKVVEVADENK